MPEKVKLQNVWVPKKTVKPVNQFAFHVGILDKYSKKIPKKHPVALSLVYGTDVPTRGFDTRGLIPT